MGNGRGSFDGGKVVREISFSLDGTIKMTWTKIKVSFFVEWKENRLESRERET